MSSAVPAGAGAQAPAALHSSVGPHAPHAPPQPSSPQTRAPQLGVQAVGPGPSPPPPSLRGGPSVGPGPSPPLIIAALEHAQRPSESPIKERRIGGDRSEFGTAQTAENTPRIGTTIGRFRAQICD